MSIHALRMPPTSSGLMAGRRRRGSQSTLFCAAFCPTYLLGAKRPNAGWSFTRLNPLLYSSRFLPGEWEEYVGHVVSSASVSHGDDGHQELTHLDDLSGKT